MADGSETTGDAGQPAGSSQPSTNSSRGIDKRTATGGKANWSDEETYKRNRNRLSNVRWPVGQEPSGEGTSERDKDWINVKLDVTEHADPDPDQRHLLHGGAELILPCATCGATLHVAAEKTGKEVLEAAGYHFPKDRDIKGLQEKLVACVCPAGHITQLHEKAIPGLIKRS